MKKFVLIASAATMALSMPAVAKDQGNKGKGSGKPEAAKVDRGNGGKDFRGRGGRQDRAQFAQRDKRQDKAQKKAEKRFEQAQKRSDKRFEQAAKRSDKRAEQVARQNERRIEDLRRARDVRNDRWDDDRRDDRRYRDTRFAGNGAFCPPGLAKKNNGCMPPGQAKKIYSVGERLSTDWSRDYMPASYRSFYTDTPNYYYRYDDNGYIYRVNRDNNLVSSLIPLLGGGFGVGQTLPTGYDIYNVPLQYRNTYYDTSDAYYRYGDNAIYQVDPQTQMIESVVALLTGDSLGIGQTLPAGYDTYNLPLQYRDQYYDNNDYMYRYADGNIYQVDAKTQIIQAIISALI